MPRKTRDPKLILMLDRRQKLNAECERHYRKMKAAFRRLEKARQSLARLTKRIHALENAPVGV